MISISTYWMSEPERGMRHWFDQIKEIGLNTIELSYKISHEQLNEFELIKDEYGISVSSIHNFCPYPNDESSPRHISNFYRLSALDEHERQQAVKWTNNSTDTAAKVGAKAVVIHAGTVDFEDQRATELFQLFVDGKKDTDEFQAEKDKLLKERTEQKGPHIEAVNKSLKEVCQYANDKGIKIGLETRYYPVEIPNFEEIGYFLDQFHKDGLYYWHDVGHAEMNSRLGLYPHKDYLETYQDKLVGVHLHGMKGRRDHLAPFEGDMNLDEYMPYFGPDVLRVIESKPFASYELLKAAVPKLS